MRQQSTAETLFGGLTLYAWLSRTGLYAFQRDEESNLAGASLATTFFHQWKLYGDVERSRSSCPPFLDSIATAEWDKRLSEATNPFSTLTDLEIGRFSYRYAEEEKTVPGLLNQLRAHFSLNTTELARVLGVERPTIYAWAKQGTTIRDNHRARLVALSRLVRFWTRMSTRPLGALKKAIVKGKTAVDLLAAEPLSENTVCEALRELAASLGSPSDATGPSRSISQIARERGWRKLAPEISDQTARNLRRNEHQLQ